MTRTMYDSTTVTDLPKSAKMVAGYVDGAYQTVDDLRRRYPAGTVVTITVLGKPGEHVCDTEPGNIGPAGAVRWAKDEVKAGRRPTLYCMGSQWKWIRRRLRLRLQMPLKAGRVSWWVADYDNDPTIPKGAVAKQYANPPLTGHHYDVSVVADYWPGVDPKPERPVKATRLRVGTRWALTYVKVHLAKRDKPVAEQDRALLHDVLVRIDKTLGRKP